MSVDEQITDPHFFGEGDFWGLFARMRREDPVHWTLNGPSKPFWSFFKHDDVKAALEDPATFSSEREGIMPLMGGPEMEAVLLKTFGLGENVLVVDPPRHTELRKVMAEPFLPRALAAMEDRTAALIAGIFDQLPDECDLVSDLGVKIPMAVICDLLDIPSSMWDSMHRWGQMALGGVDDPDYRDGTPEETVAKGWASMLEYSRQLTTARRGCPHADPLSVLANCSVGGRALTDSELAFNTQQFVLAGFETTRNAFAGGVHALLENPEQMALLRQNPKKIRLAVEEFLRYTTPALSLMRVATRDTQVRGRSIKAGDRVVLWVGSANRDEDVFQSPEAFDVSRHPNRHLSFGAGPHFCLGGPLGKMELYCAVEELLRRYDGIEIIGKVVRVHSSFVSGLKHMPVRLHKRSAQTTAPSAVAVA